MTDQYSNNTLHSLRMILGFFTLKSYTTACQKPPEDCRPAVYGAYSGIGNIDVVLSEGSGPKGVLVQVIFKFSNGVPRRIVNLLTELDKRCAGGAIPLQISDTASIYGQFGVTASRFVGTFYFETRQIDLSLEKQ